MYGQKFIRIPGKGDENDRPRRLGQSAIEDILKGITTMSGADDEARGMALDGIKNWYRRVLKYVAICPSGYGEYKERIIARHESSLIQYGTAIGMDTAGGICQVLSQIALCSQQVSGTAKRISGDIDSFQEIISGTQNRKQKSCSIFYKERLTFDEIIEKRVEIVGVSVGDLVSKDSYLGPVIDRLIGGPPGSMTFGQPIDEEGIERYWWHDYSPDLPLIESSLCLRLHLDVDLMYIHKITMQDVARVIEENGILVMKDDKGKERHSELLTVLCSPDGDVIIDIFPDESEIDRASTAGSTKMIKAQLYLQKIITEDLNRMNIKGIPEVKKLYPVSVPVWAAIDRETKLEDPEEIDGISPTIKMFEEHYGGDSMRGWEKNLWSLSLNKMSTRANGITSNDISGLLAAVGDIHILGEKRDDPVVPGAESELQEILIKMPSGWEMGTPLQREERSKLEEEESEIEEKQKKYRISIGLPIPEKKKGDKRPIFKIPGDYINAIIRDDRRRESEAFMKAREDALSTGGTYVLPEYKTTPVVLASEFFYIDTEGSNLRAILSLDGVDGTRTISNNIHEIISTLGIEAAYATFVEEMSELVRSTGKYMGTRSIDTCASLIFSQGEIHGITYSGFQSQDIGAFSRSTFERPIGVLKTSAIHGFTERADNVSVAIALGGTARIGTGGVTEMTSIEKAASMLAEKQRESNVIFQREMSSDEKKAITLDEVTRGFQSLSVSISAGVDPGKISSYSNSLDGMDRFMNTPERFNYAQGIIIDAPEDESQAVPMSVDTSVPKVIPIKFVAPKESIVLSARMEIPLPEHLEKIGIQVSTILVEPPVEIKGIDPTKIAEVIHATETRAIISSPGLLSMEEMSIHVPRLGRLSTNLPSTIETYIKGMSIGSIDDVPPIIGPHANYKAVSKKLELPILNNIYMDRDPVQGTIPKIIDVNMFIDTVLSKMGGIRVNPVGSY